MFVCRFLSGITHSELTQIGFVRSFARYLFENKTIRSRRLRKKHFTVDQLFHFIYPKLSKEKLQIQSYPLKSILDTIVAENAFVDFNGSSKKLPAAHFDSEAFLNGSRRMIKLRRSSTNFDWNFLLIKRLISFSCSDRRQSNRFVN